MRKAGKQETRKSDFFPGFLIHSFLVSKRLAMARRFTILAAVLLFAAPVKASTPNVLFILTDDQRFDLLGCAGHPILKTPNIDKLAGQGVRFRNMFVSTAICAASRASILTGKYERTHK